MKRYEELCRRIPIGVFTGQNIPRMNLLRQTRNRVFARHPRTVRRFIACPTWPEAARESVLM